MADLALVAHAGKGFDGGLVGDRIVRSVELIDVDALEAEAFEAAFESLDQMFGTGVVGPLARTRPLPTALGGNDESRGIWIEGFSNQFFGNGGAVGVGGIDEIDAQFDGAAQGGESC